MICIDNGIITRQCHGGPHCPSIRCTMSPWLQNLTPCSSVSNNRLCKPAIQCSVSYQALRANWAWCHRLYRHNPHGPPDLEYDPWISLNDHHMVSDLVWACVSSESAISVVCKPLWDCVIIIVVHFDLTCVLTWQTEGRRGLLGARISYSEFLK